MNRWRYYVLDADGRTPVPAERIEEWGRWFDAAVIKVATDHIGPAVVSTVFMGLDTAWAGPPLLFETMIFGGELHGRQRRYSTWDEAEAGHRRACDEVRRTLLKIVGGENG